MEEWMFFVYDNTPLQNEEDFLGDAIVFFSPSTVAHETRYMLCGHLAAMTNLFRAFSGSAPSTFCLREYKVVVRHVEQYTLALSGDNSHHDDALHSLLSCLADLFRFYNGSFAQFKQVCLDAGTDFVSEMAAVWQCYLPFVKRYGETVCAGFHTVPSLRFAEEIDCEIYLMCSQYLEEICSSVNGAKAGAIIFKNQVACSQLSPELTSRLCIIRPKQENLPCRSVTADFPLPHGLRLYSVFVTPDETSSLNQRIVHQQAINGTHLAVNDFSTCTSGSFLSLSTNASSSARPASDRNLSVMLQAPVSCLDLSVFGKLETAKDASSATPISTNGSQRVRNESGASTNSSSSLSNTPITAVDPSLVQIANPGSSAASALNLGSNNTDNSYNAETSDSTNIVSDSPGANMTSSIDIEKIKRLKTTLSASPDSLPNLCPDLEVCDGPMIDPVCGSNENRPMKSVDDSDGVDVWNRIAVKDQTSMTNGVVRDIAEHENITGDGVFNPSGIPEEANSYQLSISGGEKTVQNGIGEEMKPNQTGINDESKTNQNSSEHSVQSDQNYIKEEERLDLNVIQENLKSDFASTTESRNGEVLDDVRFSGFVPMGLYVQGCSDMLLVVLMDRDVMGDQEVITELWKRSLLQLAQVETTIHTLANAGAPSEEPSSGSRFRYLVFDEASHMLTGDMMRPIMSEDHEFCQAALLMSEELRQSPQTTELFLRAHGAVYGSVREGDHQLFCQRHILDTPPSSAGGSHHPSAVGGPSISTINVAHMKELLRQVVLETH